MTNSSAPLRVAIVGAGFIGRRHVEFVRGAGGCELVGAADPAPAGLAWLREQGIPEFDDYRRMLDATKPAGVIVATPNQVHETVAVECLERGIPVLIEKPIAHTVASALNIVEAARRTGVPALVGHHRRHNPLMRAARAFIATGALGRIVTVAAIDLRRKPDAYYQQAWRREPGGGPLLINGIHDIDCLRYLCGEIVSVTAIAANHARGYAVEDTAVVTIAFEGGALGTLTISDAVQGPWAWEITSGEEPAYPHQHEDTYFIAGTEGSLAVPTLTHWRNERGGGRADPFIRKQLFYEPADPWVEEVRHFAAVIRREAAPAVSAEDGTRTLAATLAITRSATTGATVAVEQMLRGDA
jgi:predicted dehydrogenase